jgi:hypothetical protein
LEEVRSEAKMLIDEWSAHGLETSWIDSRLLEEDPKVIRKVVWRFQEAVSALEAYRERVGLIAHQTSSADLQALISMMVDPMLLDEYHQQFDSILATVRVRLEVERAGSMREAEEAALKADMARLDLMRREFEEANRLEAEERVLEAERMKARRRYEKAVEDTTRWRSRARMTVSRIAELLERNPPQVLVDGTFHDGLRWFFMYNPDGPTLKVTGRDPMTRRRMVIHVEVITPDLMRLPSELERIVSFQDAGLGLGRTVPTLRLFIVENCTREVQDSIQVHRDKTGLAMALELDTGKLIHNERDLMARLYTLYFMGTLTLEPFEVLKMGADEIGCFTIDRVVEATGLPRASVDQMAKTLHRNDEVILVTTKGEYAFV